MACMGERCGRLLIGQRRLVPTLLMVCFLCRVRHTAPAVVARLVGLELSKMLSRSFEEARLGSSSRHHRTMNQTLKRTRPEPRDVVPCPPPFATVAQHPPANTFTHTCPARTTHALACGLTELYRCYTDC